jgi:hypothetical protein
MYKRQAFQKARGGHFLFSNAYFFFKNFFLERGFEITKTREFVLKLQITAQDWCCSIYLTTKGLPPNKWYS